LADDMPLFVCRLSSEGTPGYVNALLAERCRHEGVPPPEGAGAPELPEAMGTLMKGHLATLAPERPATTYEELWQDGGGARWALWTVRAFFDDVGRITHFQAVGMDITERQRAEEQIRKLLEEKGLILQEAHHRMKNHMNTMSSLLSLQAQTLNDPKAVRALEDARGRLESMAVLYDKLYRCGAPRAMPLGNYLPELVRWVVALFPLGSLVTVETEIDEVVLSPRILSTLGILVNELVSNAMKYAFSGRSDGVLRVTASHRDGRVELTVEDDGPGFPPALDPACPSGFGLRLVALLATQLEGTLAVRSGKGAHISLDFPVE
ncbi:MAG TPA: histidine kinase dimerization/phosphoacceptor domain -containing protein, partial [Synergistaceae bacterium]|nr:histidine kinase dimerization/phosphoacceptor domain -containing protein [Synergistaceae bacterium]